MCGNVPLRLCSIVTSVQPVAQEFTDGFLLILAFMKVPCVIRHLAKLGQPSTIQGLIDMITSAIYIEDTDEYRCEFRCVTGRSNEVVGLSRVRRRLQEKNMTISAVLYSGIDWTQENHDIIEQLKTECPTLHNFLDTSSYRLVHALRTVQNCKTTFRQRSKHRLLTKMSESFNPKRRAVYTALGVEKPTIDTVRGALVRGVEAACDLYHFHADVKKSTVDMLAELDANSESVLVCELGWYYENFQVPYRDDMVAIIRKHKRNWRWSDLASSVWADTAPVIVGKRRIPVAFAARESAELGNTYRGKDVLNCIATILKINR